MKVEDADDALACLLKGHARAMQHALAQGLRAYLASAHLLFALHVAQQSTTPPEGADGGGQAEWLWQSQLQVVDLACCETLRSSGEWSRVGDER